MYHEYIRSRLFSLIFQSSLPNYEQQEQQNSITLTVTIYHSSTLNSTYIIIFIIIIYIASTLNSTYIIIYIIIIYIASLFTICHSSTLNSTYVIINIIIIIILCIKSTVALYFVSTLNSAYFISSTKYS